MDTSSKGSQTRNWLAAGVIAVALAVGGYLVGLDSRPVPAPRLEEPVSTPDPTPAATEEAVLNRAGILRIAAAQADRFSGGPIVPTSFTGRRFLIRIPFGCQGPGDRGESTGWTYEQGTETLRIRVTPEVWTDAQWLSAAVAGSDVEAIEGFWLPRPWTSSEQCPAPASTGVPTGKAATAKSSKESPTSATEREALTSDRRSSVALAHFFASDSKRSDQRRGRPFEVVSKVEAEAVPTRGLQLVLEGRIALLPGGESNAACYAPGSETRPVCVVSVEFDRVAVTNPATQMELANWRL